MRFRLRTLLIILALGPPILAYWVWPTVERIINPPSFIYVFDPSDPPLGDSDDGIITMTVRP